MDIAIEQKIGGIRGSVSPLRASAAVYALMGSDTFGASSADQDGCFLVDGLPSGTYEVLLMPDTDFPELIIKGVQVDSGDITDIGNITFHQ